MSKFKVNIILITFFSLLGLDPSLQAAENENSWGSLKYNKTYLRTGPSKDTKVIWVYKRKGLPIKIIRKKDDWYLILLPENQKGWINSSQFSKKRMALIRDTISETEKIIKNKKPLDVRDIDNNPVAYVHNGVIVKLLGCINSICEVELNIKKEKYFLKRFLIENENKEETFISLNKNSFLEIVSTDWKPVVELVYNKERNKEQRASTSIDVEEFISIKGIKAQGNQLTGYKVKQINILESKVYEPPIEVSANEIEVIDENEIKIELNVSGENDTDKGQTTLF